MVHTNSNRNSIPYEAKEFINLNQTFDYTKIPKCSQHITVNCTRSISTLNTEDLRKRQSKIEKNKTRASHAS